MPNLRHLRTNARRTYVFNSSIEWMRQYIFYITKLLAAKMCVHTSYNKKSKIWVRIARSHSRYAKVSAMCQQNPIIILCCAPHLFTFSIRHTQTHTVTTTVLFRVQVWVVRWHSQSGWFDDGNDGMERRWIKNFVIFAISRDVCNLSPKKGMHHAHILIKRYLKGRAVRRHTCKGFFFLHTCICIISTKVIYLGMEKSLIYLLKFSFKIKNGANKRAYWEMFLNCVRAREWKTFLKIDMSH